MRRQISPTELNSLYNGIGEGIWHLQHVEQALVPFIIIVGVAKELNSLTPEKAENLDSQIGKLTLGQLINRGVELNVLKEPLLTRLKSFNETRKWMVHKSLSQSGDQLYTDSGREKVFRKIEEFIVEAMALQKAIAKEIECYAVGKGMNRDSIHQHAESQIRALKGEAF